MTIARLKGGRSVGIDELTSEIVKDDRPTLAVRLTVISIPQTLPIESQ